MTGVVTFVCKHLRKWKQQTTGTKRENNFFFKDHENGHGSRHYLNKSCQLIYILTFKRVQTSGHFSSIY